MEAVRKEKEELELRNEVAKDEAEKKAASDMSRLHEMLDMMQAQNQMLKNRMEQTQLEAQEAINQAGAQHRMEDTQKAQRQSQLEAAARCDAWQD